MGMNMDSINLNIQLLGVMNMERIQYIGIILIVLSLPLFGFSTTLSVESHQYHDAGATFDPLSDPKGVNESVIEERHTNVISYQNLSDRGKNLYIKSLENDGKVTFPVGEGAPGFTYLSVDEMDNLEPGEAFRKGTVIIKRPANDSLPPAGEQRNTTKYDFMTYGQEKPDFPSEEYVPFLVVPGLGFLLIFTGGYLFHQSRY